MSVKDLSEWNLFFDKSRFNLRELPELKIMWSKNWTQRNDERKALSPQPKIRMFLWLKSDDFSLVSILNKQDEKKFKRVDFDSKDLLRFSIKRLSIINKIEVLLKNFIEVFNVLYVKNWIRIQNYLIMLELKSSRVSVNLQLISLWCVIFFCILN